MANQSFDRSNGNFKNRKGCLFVILDWLLIGGKGLVRGGKEADAWLSAERSRCAAALEKLGQLTVVIGVVGLLGVCAASTAALVNLADHWFNFEYKAEHETILAAIGIPLLLLVSLAAIHAGRSMLARCNHTFCIVAYAPLALVGLVNAPITCLLSAIGIIPFYLLSKRDVRLLFAEAQPTDRNLAFKDTVRFLNHWLCRLLWLRVVLGIFVVGTLLLSALTLLDSLKREERSQLEARHREFMTLLNDEYFGSTDFPDLEQFFRASGWQTLTESEQDDLSKVIWLGVSRNRYLIGDVPQIVRDQAAASLTRVGEQFKPREN